MRPRGIKPGDGLCAVFSVPELGAGKLLASSKTRSVERKGREEKKSCDGGWRRTFYHFQGSALILQKANRPGAGGFPLLISLIRQSRSLMDERERGPLSKVPCRSKSARLRFDARAYRQNSRKFL